MGEMKPLDLLMIVGGFVLLIKGADFLVSGASSLAKKLKMSDLSIGLTVVAMGTSAPELLVNLLSGDKAEHDLVFGNIVGSNLFNLLLILGTTSIIYPLTVKRSILTKDIPYCLGSLLLLLFLVNDSLFFPDKPDGLSSLDGVFLLAIFTIFMVHTGLNARKKRDIDEDEEIQMLSTFKSVLFIFLGVAGLTFGGKFVVNGAVSLADTFQLDKKIVGLTLLAGGTSLPELATSVVAALRKRGDLAVSNIIGSNIFNTLLVLGSTALFTAGKATDGSGIISYAADILNTDMLINVAGIGLLMTFMYTLRQEVIDRWEGIVFFLSFVGYMCLVYTR